MPNPLEDLLCDLVSIPSVNPMGQAVDGDQYLEHRLTDYLEQIFRQLQVPFVRQSLEPGRENIIARLEGRPAAGAGGRILLLQAHQDTVPVEGMTIDPWSPLIRDGRLYGRGACDVKGGMAAMLHAWTRLAQSPPDRMPTLVMACSVDEEAGDRGAALLNQLWESAEPFLPRQPDAAIVAEPTALDVVVAHRGSVRWKCHTPGRAAHSSQPELGENAVYRMAHVVTALQSYARDVVATLAEHPRCGRPTLCVGTIQGGVSYNTVPDKCSIAIDRRLVPGEQAQTARDHVLSYLASQPTVDFQVQHEPPFCQGNPLRDENNGELAESLRAAVCRSGHPSQLVGAPYGTDAGRICSFGIPTVVFGPGSIEQAHTACEWIALDQLHQAAEVLDGFIRSFPDAS